MITFYTFLIALGVAWFARGKLDIRGIGIAALATIAGYIHPILYPVPFALFAIKTKDENNVLVSAIKKHPVLIMFLPISHGSYLASVSPVIRDTIAELENQGAVPAGLYEVFSRVDLLEKKLPPSLVPVYKGTAHLPPEEQEGMYHVLTTTALTDALAAKARRELALASAIATISVFMLAGALVVSVAMRLFG